jgi:Ca2+-binding EF-hand superfamily protein
LSRPDHINFTHFAGWYTNLGFALIPWLELLDLQKWRLALAHKPENMPLHGQQLGYGTAAAKRAEETGLARQQQDSEDDYSSGEVQESADTAVDDSVVFEFQLGGEFRLVFTKSDVRRLHDVMVKTRLGELQAESVYHIFDHVKEGVCLPKAGFDRIIRALIPGKSLSAQDKRSLSVILSSIYSAYDRAGDKRVSLLDFCAGFSVFAQGNKAGKLSVAFEAFDSGGEGSLDQTGLQRFLSAFLTMLFALNDEACSRPAEEAWQAVDRYTGTLARQIIDGFRPQFRITFAQFAQFYTNGGYTVVPWLELLCVDKWPIV